MLVENTQRPATNRQPNRWTIKPRSSRGRCALAIDECSDDDDQRLTIRTSQRQGQRVAVFFLVRFQEVLR